MTLRAEEPLAVAIVKAIRGGDLESLRRLLGDNPGLATAGILSTDRNCKKRTASRTLLHVATDWPGHFPNGAATVAALIEAGADVNARFSGSHSETPLHWAASSNDVAVLDVLLDAGAEIEATGGVIGGGAPLADAVAFGQWQAARRLVERGARTALWEAAALGFLDRVEQYFSDASAADILQRSPRPPRPSAPPPDEVTHAFWCACHGGQRRTAEYLLGRSADLNWIGYDQLTPIEAAIRSGANDLVEWLRGQGARSAKEAG